MSDAVSNMHPICSPRSVALQRGMHISPSATKRTKLTYRTCVVANFRRRRWWYLARRYSDIGCRQAAGTEGFPHLPLYRSLNPNSGSEARVGTMGSIALPLVRVVLTRERSDGSATTVSRPR